MTLSELIASNPALVSESDQVVYDWLTTPSIDKQDVVPKSKLLQWCGGNDRLKNIKLTATNTVHPANNIAETAVLLLTASDVPTFNTGDATNIAMLDALVAASVIDATDKAALLDLGLKTITPLQANNLTARIRIGDVTKARAV